MSQSYGATPEEWITFDTLLGLTEDLLPVVSHPAAKVSAKSSIKKKGKVPSKYNISRKVVGIPEWTSFKATSSLIDKWSKEPDYGICIQTRNIRAIDIDVPDSDEVTRILNFINVQLRSLEYPLRVRSNSSKCLLAFRVAADIHKRVFRTHNGIIELLGNGQQFISAGTHESGVRYEWENLTDFPELAREEFENLWNGLVKEFGIEEPISAHARQQGETYSAHDETLAKLNVIEWGQDGQAHIDCPFKAEHTSETGISSTSYFPKGTHGYDQGHFICLHAHCAKRTDDEFLDALGLRAADFEPIIEETKSNLPDVWPSFKRTESGEIYPTIDNLYRALQRDDVCSARIAYDSFREEVVITSVKNHALEWRLLLDNDYTLLQLHLERNVGFKPIAIDLLRRAVQAVAYANSFDSAILWLEGLQWDGIARVNRFMCDYIKSESSAYAQAVSRYLWSALAGRVLVPGVKADMVPIWEGGQGRNKSSTLEALVPNSEYFLEVDLNEKEGELARKMRGKLIGEIKELRGLQTKDLESIKAFIDRRYEEWVPKYKEKSHRFARRLIFIATTNHKEILADETGNRRWLPIHVERADIVAIRRDRDQLWAEGRELFKEEGICFAQAETLSHTMHQDYAITDPWGDIIETWMKSPEDIDGRAPVDKGYLTTAEIMREALHIEVRNMKGIDGKRIAKILRETGCERVKKRLGAKVEWVWLPPVADLING